MSRRKKARHQRTGSPTGRARSSASLMASARWMIVILIVGAALVGLAPAAWSWLGGLWATGGPVPATQSPRGGTPSALDESANAQSRGAVQTRPPEPVPLPSEPTPAPSGPVGV